MGAAGAPTEIVVLGWSVVLLLAQIFLQGGLATYETGLGYNMSARDAGTTPKSVYAQRAERALRNLLETYPAFIALALALVVTNRAGGLGAQGALIWIIARALYVPIYIAGVPVVRTLVYGASIVGLAEMLGRLMGWN